MYRLRCKYEKMSCSLAVLQSCKSCKSQIYLTAGLQDIQTARPPHYPGSFVNN
jgi:hypothetical protein